MYVDLGVTVPFAALLLDKSLSEGACLSEKLSQGGSSLNVKGGSSFVSLCSIMHTCSSLQVLYYYACNDMYECSERRL